MTRLLTYPTSAALGATGPAGATGAAGPTGPQGSGGAYDINNSGAYVDAFGAASAYDQEFNRTTNPTAAPTGWVFQNQNSATYLEQLGVGQVSIPAGYNTLQKLTCLVQPVSAASAYTAVAHVEPTNDAAVTFTPGLCVTDGTKAIMVWNTADLGLVSRWADIASTYTDNIGSVTCPNNATYFKMKKNNANSYDFLISRDGTNWLSLLAAYDVGAYMTPTHFGFGMRQPAGAPTFSFDWLRVR